MPAHDTPAPRPLAAVWFALLAAYRPVVRQERVFVRLVLLSVGSVLALGRHTLSQVLVGLGVGDRDWTAWYRLFNRGRIDLLAMQTTLVAQFVAEVAPDGPIAVGVDGTQLPRTSRRLPGCGYAVQVRTPKWRRGIHLAQRFVGISGLLPRSASGESRAIPLRWLPLRTAKTTPIGAAPERSEGAGALELLGWLRERLDAAGRAAQPLVALGDGAYATAGVLGGLPARTVLFARCAKNRALYAVPGWRAGRGRQRRYGERGPTPTQTLHQAGGWRRYRFPVRGRTVTLTATATGPWLVRGAPFAPVLLVVVKGVERGRGTTRRQRDPQFFLTSVVMTSEDEWHLPVPLADLLAWAWQRWEVEVMHRELKSSFGVGEPQAFSDRGAASVVPWLVWVYALLVLAGYRAWGYAPPPGTDRGCWWRPRRWSLGRLLQTARADLWALGEFQPVWRQTPDDWGEMHAWTATLLPSVLGGRRL
jgi:DDE superfamily endonuclease